MVVLGISRFLSVFFMKMLQNMFAKSMIFDDFHWGFKQKLTDFRAKKKRNHVTLLENIAFCWMNKKYSGLLHSHGKLIVYSVAFRFFRVSLKISSEILIFSGIDYIWEVPNNRYSVKARNSTQFWLYYVEIIGNVSRILN